MPERAPRALRPLSPLPSSLSPAFACQKVSLTRERRGYRTTIEIYDAQWQGFWEEEVGRGPYLLRGRPLSEAPSLPGSQRLLALGARPRICVLEEGEYQIVARVSPLKPDGSGRAPLRDLAPPEFWPMLRAAGAARDDPASASSLWERSARLRFAGAFGRARVDVRAKSELAAIPLEVFCQKLDWEGDLPRLLADLSEVATSLALRARGSTLLSLGPVRGLSRAPLERLVVLRAVLSSRWLPGALARIRELPHMTIQAAPRLVPLSACSRLRPEDLLQAISRQGGARKGGSSFQRVLAQSRERSVNTPENRAVLAVLSRVKREAGRLWEDLSGDPALAREAQVLLRRASSLPNPFGEDFLENPPRRPSLFFRRQPGYREVYLAGRLIRRALSPRPGAPSLLEAPGRTMPYLYEVWSFLMLARSLAGLFGGGFTPLTARGEGGAVRLRTGEMQTIAPGVKIGYQMHFAPRARISSYSIPLRPDIYVELLGSRLVFDAKYRLEPEQEAPRHEDLLLVHAYKDALGMDGSFLFYPGRGQPILYPQAPPSALPAVGAFPLRPGKEALCEGEEALRGFLRACLPSSLRRPEREWGRRAAERKARYGSRAEDEEGDS